MRYTGSTIYANDFHLVDYTNTTCTNPTATSGYGNQEYVIVIQ